MDIKTGPEPVGQIEAQNPESMPEAVKPQPPPDPVLSLLHTREANERNLSMVLAEQMAKLQDAYLALQQANEGVIKETVGLQERLAAVTRERDALIDKYVLSKQPETKTIVVDEKVKK